MTLFIMQIICFGLHCHYLNPMLSSILTKINKVQMYLVRYEKYSAFYVLWFMLCCLVWGHVFFS